MTLTLPQSLERPAPYGDGLIRLPEVALPPAPSFGGRARFVSLVLLGYAYVLGMLAFFALVFISLLAAGAIWPLFVVGAVFVVVLPALRVKIPRPEGVELNAQNAPLLLDLVEHRRRELRASRLSGVLLVEEPTAYVCEIPRLGLLGWNRIYLVLGLPYLLALTPEELEGIVAHELAHVARRHGGGFAGARGSLMRWQQLDARLDERQHWSGKFFRPFLKRYLPRLEQATLAVRRWHEYEADRTAADAAGVDAATSGLLRISLLDKHLDESLWDEMMRRADVAPQPPAPFSLMRQVVRQEFQHGHARLSELLSHVESDWTHPAPAQRLRAIGVTTIQPSRLKPPAATAADVYLEPGLHELIARFDDTWRGGIADLWRERFEESQLLREQLTALEAGGDASPEGLQRRAALTARLDGPVAARKHYEQLLHEDDENAVAHYWVGLARLALRDDRGLESLTRAAELDVHGTPDAAAAAIDFLINSDRLVEVAAWRARAQEYALRAAIAGEERSRLRPTDEVEPHGLPPETVDLVREELADVSGIGRAYLVRKRCSEFGDDEPLWIIGITVRARRLRMQRRRHELIQTVVERLEVYFGGRFWVVITDDVYAPLAPAMAAVPDAQLAGRRYRTAGLRRRAGVRSCVVAALIVVIGAVGLIRVLESGSPAPPTNDYQSPGSVNYVDPEGISRWATTANATCATIRAQYGAVNRNAQRELERRLLDVLARTEGPPPGSAVAIVQAQSRLAGLDRAQVHARAGQPTRATAELRKHDSNLGVQRSLTALGAPACAAP